jgi:hypothetical protein
MRQGFKGVFALPAVTLPHSWSEAGAIDEAAAGAGAYCRSHVTGCFCAVGWPYARQCPACRDCWPVGAFRDSYCICQPQDDTQ